MSDEAAGSKDSKRLGPQWIVAIAGLITAIGTLLGVALSQGGGSESSAPDTAPITTTAAASSLTGDPLPDVSIVSTERPEDGRWVVRGSFATESPAGASARSAGASALRRYDVFVIAETNDRRYVSAAASFESTDEWRTQFLEPIESNAVRFVPGVAKHSVDRAVASSFGVTPQSSTRSTRDRLQTSGTKAFDKVGTPYTAS